MKQDDAEMEQQQQQGGPEGVLLSPGPAVATPVPLPPAPAAPTSSAAVPPQLGQPMHLSAAHIAETWGHALSTAAGAAAAAPALPSELLALTATSQAQHCTCSSAMLLQDRRMAYALTVCAGTWDYAERMNSLLCLTGDELQ